MRTVILMNNGNKYVVEDMDVNQVITHLSEEDFVILPGTGDKPDFAINTLQVSAIFPAHERSE